VAATTKASVQVYESLESLPEPVIAFFANAADRDFFQSIPWYRTVLRTAGPPLDQPRIYVADIEGRPVAALIVRKRMSAGRLKTRMLLSPSNGPYAAVSGPVLDGELGPAGLRAIVAEIARTSPAFHVLRFDCLDRQSSEYVALVKAFRSATMLLRPFQNDIGHYADVRGQAIEHVLSQRSPIVRDYVHHAVRGFADSGRGRFLLFTVGPDIKSALVDYALVDVQSWQDQEIYPDCTLKTIEAAANAGALRLGLYYVDGDPAAAQIWIVSGGRATIWRTRFAKRFATLGTVPALTFEMFRHAIDADHVVEINSGPGDDKIMHMWFDQQRERAGFLVFNPRTLKGWLATAGHMFGGRMIEAARWLRQLLVDVLSRGRRVARVIMPTAASAGDNG